VGILALAALLPLNAINASAANTTTLVTTASGTVVVGGSISDNATLSGGAAPTGTIIFSAFGPNNATCAGAPAFTSTVAVSAGNFTYPSGAFTTTAAGTYRFTASYSGDVNNLPSSSPCNAVGESVIVTAATPTLTTTASGSGPVGGSISDSARLLSGFNPTGTITFFLYGAGDATCSAPPLFTSTVTVIGNGTYNSSSFTPTSPGTYRYIAQYSGDANNSGTGASCNGANESVTMIKATPGVSTTASGPVTVGGTISDSATVTAGFSPTGTITFTAYAPADATCALVPVFTSVVPVAGAGSYPSATFTPATAGTYRWIAAYSGDANNNSVTLLCNDPNEASSVNRATTTVVTTASGPITIGGNISDSATLSGGVAPTGTITFSVYGPADATCATVPVTATVTVAGNGAYPSGAFTPTGAGTFRFIAAYSGDVNNAPSTTACNDANESVVVNPASPTLVTAASASVTVGANINDTATLAAGYAPSGTMSIALYGPNDATCSNVPVVHTTSVAGNGNYTAAAFAVTAVGTYRFIAVYGGDANNNATGTGCNDANESVVVTKATTVTSAQVSGSVSAGGSINDVATLAGGFSPTGTITFTLYNNSACTGTPVSTTTVTVTGNGTYTSPSFTTSAPGTYTYVTAYSGDANNAASTTLCASAAQAVVVTPGLLPNASSSGPTVVTRGGSAPSWPGIVVSLLAFLLIAIGGTLAVRRRVR